MKTKITKKGGSKFKAWLERNKNANFEEALEDFGKTAIEIIRENTPKDTGLTAESYNSKVKNNNLILENTNVISGTDTNLAVMLNYGHGTGTGGYVEGSHFMDDTLDTIVDDKKLKKVIKHG